MRRTAAALLSLAWVSTAGAQQVKDALELTRQAVETQRRFLVSGALPLSEAEATAFWPLYDEYEKQRRGVDERWNRLITDFVGVGDRLTDTQAGAMLDEALKIDDERLKLRRHWRERMAAAIPPRKLARFFQIEHKLDAVVRADVARQIPLVP